MQHSLIITMMFSNVKYIIFHKLVIFCAIQGIIIILSQWMKTKFLQWCILILLLASFYIIFHFLFKVKLCRFFCSMVGNDYHILLIYLHHNTIFWLIQYVMIVKWFVMFCDVVITMECISACPVIKFNNNMYHNICQKCYTFDEKNT